MKEILEFSSSLISSESLTYVEYLSFFTSYTYLSKNILYKVLYFIKILHELFPIIIAKTKIKCTKEIKPKPTIKYYNVSMSFRRREY